MPEPEPVRTAPHLPDPSRSLDRTASRTNTAGDAPPTATDGTPVVVPGYELLGELGRGGMGVVYRARHVKLNREVALKMVIGAVGRRELIRFLAEAEAVAAVRHANVVQVYDFGEADGRPFLALEFLPGARSRNTSGRPGA